LKLIKNWKETWGSLVIILLPLIYTIDYTKNFIMKIPYNWIISIVLFIIAWIQTNNNYKSKKELNENISYLSYQNNTLKSNLDAIPENMIKHLYKHLKLGNNDRATVYRVKDNEWFIPVGRFSENPLYKKSGRDKYPIDSGFIGKCWAEEEVRVQNLPNFYKNHERYINVVKQKCYIEEHTLKSLRMKSRSFYCKRLTFNGDEPLAVVVIESTDAALPVKPEEVRMFLDGPYGKSLVEAIRNNLPAGKEV
jgi:hypothetical protein